MESLESFPKELIFSQEKDNFQQNQFLESEISPVFESFDSAQFQELSQSSPLKKNLFTTKKSKTSFITIKKSEPILSKKGKQNNSGLIGRWTKQERVKFAYAIWKFGTDWKTIKNYVSTRNYIQLRSHGQKFLAKLKNNEIIVKKGLNFKNYNWENSIKYLKENLNDEELFNVLSSIESELDDNKRMTERYLERKRLRNKNDINALNEESCNSALSSCEESWPNNSSTIITKELNENDIENKDFFNNKEINLNLDEEKNEDINLTDESYLNNDSSCKNQNDNSDISIFFNIFSKNLSSLYNKNVNPEKDNYEIKTKLDFFKY